ncbi:MAG: cyclic 2,3-diphosphoglycerate synthase [Aeropyrum sp.]|nr:cyclic 2,3-diphosphoglycerate synthase [Aeropyrum sp.]MCE4616726.1 cyclic 2,3-diphosphoglycerate synthase [Aeropyrum sp.]
MPGGRPQRVLILGAGGRDFHNFNVYFRNNPEYRVVAFTAAQIPGVSGRRYPPELAGPLYPSGIPILNEEGVEEIIRSQGVDLAVLSYSDLDYGDVGRILSRVLAAGANFLILGPRDTMLVTSKPVIAVTAVRTGAGKSTVSREIAKILRSRGLRVAPVRHPMVYVNITPDIEVQRFETLEDLDRYGVTVEEREEYEAYIKMGFTVFAGVDYGSVLREVERESDVILWDGGNNDLPFFRPDFMITVADALRPGQETSSFPGEVNVRLADVVIINKVDRASESDVKIVEENVSRLNSRAIIVKAASEVEVDNPSSIMGKKVVVVEDSPTVTHGGAPYGAGYVAAEKYGAEIVDPRPYARGVIEEMYSRYPHMGPVVPSTGYNRSQLKDLEDTLNSVPADAIVSGTPIDIERLLSLDKPVVKVRYRLKILEGPSLSEIVDMFLDRVKDRLPKSP